VGGPALLAWLWPAAPRGRSPRRRMKVRMIVVAVVALVALGAVNYAQAITARAALSSATAL
jgi:hypothetical protein